MIVVETYPVQSIQSKYKVSNDQPIADRLDRSYFGFDQDYFERMPLLVNALQENNYLETTSENINSPILQKKKQRSQANSIKPELPHTIYKSIRRTTPRPFIYEYQSPNPSPFTKIFNSRSWVESYRNAQRLKNLNQVIQYLEKTLNAKFGDIYEPSTAQIAFSGVYVAPINKKQLKPNEVYHEPQSSKLKHKINNVSDPLFIYKPDNPGDINLLVDGYRFSPMLKSNIKNLNRYIPMFRPGTNKRKCIGYSCHYSSQTQGPDSENVKGIPSATSNKPQALDVMLNLYPVHRTNIDEIIDVKTTSPSDKIYFTTVRPSYQFKKKSNLNNMSIRRTTFRPKFPKVVTEKRNGAITTTQATSHVETTTAPQLIVHFNVYSIRKSPTLNNKADDFYHTTTSMSTNTTDTNHKYDFPIINSTNVEDYHVGSSGIIPVQGRTHLPLPTYPTPKISQFNQQYFATESITTNPPDIIKFSPEDAKIPVEYLNLNMRKSDITLLNESDFDVKHYEVSTQPELKLEHGSAALNGKDIEATTLVIKLKNIAITTEPPSTETLDYSEENIEEVTTSTETGDTYVPMINGHYRSSKRKSLNTLFHENSEKYRKKRLESSNTLRRSTYVPMYVEIKRNRINSSIEND